MARGGSIFDPRGEGSAPRPSIDRTHPTACVRTMRTPEPSALLPLRAAEKVGIFGQSFAAVAAVA